jgi:hypothetical protein
MLVWKLRWTILLVFLHCTLQEPTASPTSLGGYVIEMPSHDHLLTNLYLTKTWTYKSKFQKRFFVCVIPCASLQPIPLQLLNYIGNSLPYRQVAEQGHRMAWQNCLPNWFRCLTLQYCGNDRHRSLPLWMGGWPPLFRSFSEYTSSCIEAATVGLQLGKKNKWNPSKLIKT